MAGVVHEHELKSRMGTGAGGPDLEDGLKWAAANGFHYIDFGCDYGANALSTWDAARIASVRTLCEEHDIHLGIHTLSAVNVGEFSPFLSEAVEQYLQAHVDLGEKLGVEHIITHAGLHQSSEIDLRKKSGLKHLH